MTKKSKLKLSLIDDYTKIIILKNFFKNPFDDVEMDSTSSFLFQNLKNETADLEQTYNNLLQILNLKDSSFDVLCEQLSVNNTQFELLKANNFSTLQSTLIVAKQSLGYIRATLNERIACFKLNVNNLN